MHRNSASFGEYTLIGDPLGNVLPMTLTLLFALLISYTPKTNQFLKRATENVTSTYGKAVLK